MSVAFLVVACGCMGSLCTLAFIDIIKTWKQRRRDELRRDSFIRSVQTISEYCYYKGLSEGFDMSSNQE